MALSSIPSYIRNLANAVSANPYMTLDEINDKMESLGWDNFTLDDHTLHLTLALLTEHADVQTGQPLWQGSAEGDWNSAGGDAREDATS
jgi:hypothetical protein